MEQFIKYLNGRINSANAVLEKFQSDIVTKGYEHAFEWSAGAFRAVAIKSVCEQLLIDADNYVKYCESTGNEPDNQKFKENIADKIISDSQFGKSSTSVHANVLYELKKQALGEIYSDTIYYL